MARSKLPIAQIEGYQPAMDYRKAGSIGVIAGQNFSWDPAGVRSDFSSRLVAGSQRIASFGDHVQHVKVGDDYHVIAGNKVWRFVPNLAGAFTGTWQQIATLTPIQTPDYDAVPEYLRAFTSTYMAGYAYVSHWNFGCYRVNVTTGAYTRLKQADIPGFPSDANPIYGIAETNGRLVLVTKTTVYWSAPNQPENWTPTLGGAGFQVLGERIAGEPRAILRVPSGVVIWTTSGALGGEFLANQIVFRWFQMSTDVMPLNQAACVEMPDGGHLVLTRLGMFKVSDLKQPVIVSPLFGEFLREYVRTRPIESGHLWYSLSDNRMMLAMRQANSQYVETFSLDVSLDKWGIFSQNHIGMLLYAKNRSPLAYINSDGIVSYLLPARDPRKNRENPNAPGTMLGLASWVELGYIRDERLMVEGGGLQELTDLNIYRSVELAGVDDVVVDEGSITVWPPADSFTTNEGVLPDPIQEEVDEGDLDIGSLSYAYQVQFLSDTFTTDPMTGAQFGHCDATLAFRGPNVDTWTGRTLGYYQRVRIIASEPGEFFRLNAMDCTMAYAGQGL